MKLLYKTLVFIFCVSLSQSAGAQNTPPQINIQSVVIDEENQTVTLIYDLSDEEETALEVFLRVAPTGSQQFDIIPVNTSGAIGFPVTPGNGLEITWNYTGALGNSDSYDFKLIADDRYVIPIEELVGQVDSALLRTRMENIAGIRHYITNPENLNRCRDTLETAFLDYGLQTFRQNFPNLGTTGQNIIGDHWGQTQSNNIIIVDGHYDSVSNSPGADDNGTATVGVLEAARILSAYNFRKSLRFIGFDFEETGLDGSMYYVDHLSNSEEIEGVLNMEMIGYYSEAPNSQTLPTGFSFVFPEAAAAVEAEQNRGNFLINVGPSFGLDFYNAFNAAAATYVPELRLIGLEVVNPLLVPDLLRSDHGSFWEDNIPALMLTDGADFRNPYYHTPADTIGTLNFTFMANAVKAVIATAAEVAEPMHSGEAIASNFIISDADHLHELPCSYIISPNPAQDIINVKFGSCAPLQLEIQLFDVTGKLVLNGQHNTQLGSLMIDATNLAPGVFWLQLTDGHNFSTQRIVIH